MAEIGRLQYDSWSEFKARFTMDIFGSEYYRPDEYVFRGQRDCDWRLATSFDRWVDQRNINPSQRPQTAARLLAIFRKECEALKVSERVTSNPDYLTVLGQHYGLPTRLLDWTDSAYIAAFFAFCDTIESRSDCQHVAIWALRLNSPAWNDHMGVRIVEAPVADNERLRNQVGKFTLSNTPFAYLEEYVKHVHATESPLIKILLPSTDARSALADLDAMGINHARAFPDITGCALAAKMRLLLNQA